MALTKPQMELIKHIRNGGVLKLSGKFNKEGKFQEQYVFTLNGNKKLLNENLILSMVFKNLLIYNFETNTFRISDNIYTESDFTEKQLQFLNSCYTLFLNKTPYYFENTGKSYGLFVNNKFTQKEIQNRTFNALIKKEVALEIKEGKYVISKEVFSIFSKNKDTNSIEYKVATFRKKIEENQSIFLLDNSGLSYLFSFGLSVTSIGFKEALNKKTIVSNKNEVKDIMDYLIKNKKIKEVKGKDLLFNNKETKFTKELTGKVYYFV